MGRHLLCKIGVHKWNRATFLDCGSNSNVLNWKQSCDRCHKTITWVQPKGLNEKFYPLHHYKRSAKIFWFLVILALILWFYYNPEILKNLLSKIKEIFA